MMLVFLCPTHFTMHNALQVHPCCHRRQYSVLLYSQVHCVYAPHSLSRSSVDRHLGCFRVLVIVNFSSHSQPCPPSVFSITVQVTIYLSCLILRFRSHPIYIHIYIYICIFPPPTLWLRDRKGPLTKYRHRWWKLWTTREFPRSHPCFLPFPHYSTWSSFPVNPFGSTIRTYLSSTSVLSKPPSPLAIAPFLISLLLFIACLEPTGHGTARGLFLKCKSNHTSLLY